MTKRYCDWCREEIPMGDPMALLAFTPIADAGNVIKRELCFECETRVRTFIEKHDKGGR